MFNILMDRRRFMTAAATLTAAVAITGDNQSQSQAQPAAPSPGGGEGPPLAARLAAYVDGLGYADIDATTLEAVKLRLVDTFGCALAALDEPVVASCYRIARAAGDGKATLIGTRHRVGTEMAAFANGAAIRYYDLNEGYASREVGHPSHFVSVCLAVAEAEGRSVRDVIVAIVAAYEIECRLFDAVSLNARGWDNTTYGVVTAALAAGKLMGLSVKRLTEAVNIALVDHVAMNQTRVQVLSNWKGLADASASRHGVFAAILAREGITGPSPIFEGRFGLNTQVAGEPIVIDTASFGGHGRPFRINDVLVKPYPAQGHTLTAVEAAIRLSGKISDRGAIAKVSVATTQFGYRQTATGPDVWAPATKETADHSMPYIVARALLDGTITNDSYAPERLAAADVRALMAKITIAEDPTLTALYPRQIPNRVVVTLRSGEVLTEQVDDLPGSPRRPLTRADIEAKFWRNVGPRASAAAGKALIQTIWSLEQMTRVEALLDAVAAVRPQ